MLRGSRRAKSSSKKKQNIVEHPRSSEVDFTNREIGWLHFNQRVLHEAEDQRNPILERVRFLAISDSNLDEFFMKRVGGLKRQIAAGVSPKSSDGKTPQEQLVLIREYVISMMKSQGKCYEKLIRELRQRNIYLLKWHELSAAEQEEMRLYYKKNIFPVLTPLSVDPGHPFPFISNLSISLGVTLRHVDQDEKLFARLKIPKNKDGLPQWIRLTSAEGQYRFVSFTEIVRQNLGDLFPSMEVLNVMPFRITRNAEFDRTDDEAEDLLQMIAEELRQRRFAEVVRIEHGPNPDPWMLKFLRDELELHDEDIYEHPGELDYSDLHQIANINESDLKYPVHSPVLPLAFTDENIPLFEALKASDQLVHHPYESFSGTVERFVREAAFDPRVLAIKMTLYRTGDKSPFVRSLIRAAEAGKQVVCLVELQARFDEERNIYWAQALENAGVHVVYGIVGLKTHAKIALVVRQEESGIQCYAHVGTGNYNVATSRLYTDVGLITTNEKITSEIVEFFHYLTGRSLKKNYEHLLVAPVNMFKRFKEMIERERQHALQGRPAQIIAKCNSLEENDLVSQLYEASSSGVQIDLIVRGFACIRPGLLKRSENIRVISIIGRFLEHSRIFYFRNGMNDPLDGEFYIGSADWMYRNLHARVEAIVPIWERALKEKLWEILQTSINDRRQTWDMHQDGSYKQRISTEPGVQEILTRKTQQRHSVVESTVVIEEPQSAESEYENIHRPTRHRRRTSRIRGKTNRRQSKTTDVKGSSQNAKSSTGSSGSGSAT